MKKIFFLSVLCVLCVGSLAAETAGNTENNVRYLTLDDALTLGLENNPDLLTARRNLESLARTEQGKWNSFIPNLSLNGSYSNTHNQDSNSWKWSGSTGISLSFNFGIPFQMNLKTLEYQAGILEYQKLEATTLNTIAGKFYTLIAEKNNIDILVQAGKLAEEQYQQDLANYNRGLVSELTLLQSRYAYLSSQPEIDSAKSTYETNLDNFKMLIGISGDIELTGSLEVQKISLPEGNILADKYTEQNYDVQQQAVAVEIAVLTKKQSTASELAPTLNLSENLSFSEGTNGKAVDMNGSFTASVSIPLTGFIPYSSTNLNLKNLEDQIENAQQNLTVTITETRNALALLPDKINRLWNAVELAQLNYSISDRAYQLSLEGYNSGLVSQTDLGEARQQMTTAQQAVYETQNEYLSALYDATLTMNISIEELITTYGGTNDGE